MISGLKEHLAFSLRLNSNRYLRQPALLEVLRGVCCSNYARAMQNPPLHGKRAVHRNAVAGHASRLAAACLRTADETLSVSEGIDLLIDLGDIAHVGGGYCIPRESRIIRFSERYGRIGGGLPLSHSQHSGIGVKEPQIETLGRLVSLSNVPTTDGPMVEHSLAWQWRSQSADALLVGLHADLPTSPVGEPPDPVYYNAARRGQSRRDRWQSHRGSAEYTVARTEHPIRHYYLTRTRRRSSSLIDWFDLDNEVARLWLLWAERDVETRNRLRGTWDESTATLRLPNFLPKPITFALVACASETRPISSGHDLVFPREASSAVEEICRSANVEILWRAS